MTFHFLIVKHIFPNFYQLIFDILNMSIEIQLPLWYVKDLEVIAFILKQKKKAGQNENEQLFLEPSENWGHGAALKTRKMGEYRESQLTGIKNHMLWPETVKNT